MLRVFSTTFRQHQAGRHVASLSRAARAHRRPAVLGSSGCDSIARERLTCRLGSIVSSAVVPVSRPRRSWAAWLGPPCNLGRRKRKSPHSQLQRQGPLYAKHASLAPLCSDVERRRVIGRGGAPLPTQRAAGAPAGACHSCAPCVTELDCGTKVSFPIFEANVGRSLMGVMVRHARMPTTRTLMALLLRCREVMRAGHVK